MSKDRPTASPQRHLWEGGPDGLEPAKMKAAESLEKNRGDRRTKSRAGSPLPPPPPPPPASPQGPARNRKAPPGNPGPPPPLGRTERRR